MNKCDSTNTRNYIVEVRVNFTFRKKYYKRIHLLAQLTLAILCAITAGPSRFVISNVLGNAVALVTGLRAVLAQPYRTTINSSCHPTTVSLTVVFTVLAGIVVHHQTLVFLEHVFKALFWLVAVYSLALNDGRNMLPTSWAAADHWSQSPPQARDHTAKWGALRPWRLILPYSCCYSLQICFW